MAEPNEHTPPANAPRSARPGPAAATAGSLLATTAMLAALTSPQHALAEQLEVRNTRQGGPGSLQQAIRRSNSDPDHDRIVFRDRLHGYLNVNTGLALTAPAKIVGPGRKRLQLRGPESGELLRVKRVGRKVAITDLGLLRIGIVVNPHRTEGRLKLRRTTLSGDGIDADGVRIEPYSRGYSPEVDIGRTTIEGFHSGVSTAYGSARIDRSTISGNGPGHGVEVGYYGDARITRTTISGNTSSETDPGLGRVAGAGLISGYGSAEIVNSTISGNTAVGPDSAGGGLYGGDIEVRSSTVTDNAAANGGGVAYLGDLTLRNSIVAGNRGATSALADCDGSVASRGGNVIGAPGTCEVRPSDTIGVDPLLGPLADNGGPTLTHGIARNSPALGNAIGRSPKRDQRRVRRDRNPDTGAFEWRRGHGD